MEQQFGQRYDAGRALRYLCLILFLALGLTIFWAGSITAFVMLNPGGLPGESQHWSVGADGFQPLWLRLVSVVVKPLIQTTVFGPPRVQANETKTLCDKAISWIIWMLRLLYVILFCLRVRDDFSNMSCAYRHATTSAEALLMIAMVLSRSSNLSSAASTFAIWEMVVGHVYWLELHRDGGSEMLATNHVWYKIRLHEVQTWWKYRNHAICVHGNIFVLYGFLCLPYRLCGLLFFVLFAVSAICLWPYIFLLAILSVKLYRQVFAWLLLRLSQRRTPRAIAFVEHKEIPSQRQVLIACCGWPLPLTSGVQRHLLPSIVSRIDEFRLKPYERVGVSIWYELQARVFRATGATLKSWRSIFERTILYTVFLPFAVGSVARFSTGESYEAAIAATWKDEPSFKDYIFSELHLMQRFMGMVSLLF